MHINFLSESLKGKDESGPLIFRRDDNIRTDIKHWDVRVRTRLLAFLSMGMKTV